MKKRYVIATFPLFAALPLHAAEGLRYPSAPPAATLADMREAGCDLQQNELYSERAASLKDQVVLFSTGVSGVILSESGLTLLPASGLEGLLPETETPYAAFADTSGAPLEGVTAWRLLHTENVTWRVRHALEGIDDETSRRQAADSVESRLLRLKRLRPGTVARLHRDAAGSYLLCVYRQYDDVRLCYLPGRHWRAGGDTRHRADFALIRLYGETPVSATLASDPLGENDFALTLGFPGPGHPCLPVSVWRERYLTLPRAELTADSLSAALTGNVLSVSPRAGFAPCHQPPAAKSALETAYAEWTERGGAPARYAGALDSVNALSARRAPLLYRTVLIGTTLRDLPPFRAMRRTTLLRDGYLTAREWERLFASADTALWARMAETAAASTGLVPAGKARAAIRQSALTDASRIRKAFRKDTVAFAGDDPLVTLARLWEERLADDLSLFTRLDSLRSIYLERYYEGLTHFRPELAERPDGNRTLRFSYGRIQGYSPRDGVLYTAFTTMAGLPEPCEADSASSLPDGAQDTVCQFMTDADGSPSSAGSAVYDDQGYLTGMLLPSDSDRYGEPYTPERSRRNALSVHCVAVLLQSDPAAAPLLNELTWSEPDDELLLQYTPAAPDGAPAEPATLHNVP